MRVQILSIMVLERFKVGNLGPAFDYLFVRDFLVIGVFVELTLLVGSQKGLQVREGLEELWVLFKFPRQELFP